MSLWNWFSGKREKLPESSKASLEPRQVEQDRQALPDSEIASLLSLLGRRDILCPPEHLDKLFDLGEKAIPHLLPLLDSTDLYVLIDVATLLGQLGAKQAIPKLKIHSQSQWAEVRQACLTALSVLDSKTGIVLQLDRQSPYEQIRKLWTAIFQGHQQLYAPEVLLAWCIETVSAMPTLSIPSDKKAQAWSMLGSLYYKSIQPAWDGSPGAVSPCSEAKKCYQEAVQLDSSVDHWNRLAKNF